MVGDTDLARVGALIGDPGRARVLRALADGRELPASVLAAEAGVAASTASVHLRKLVDGGLVTAERHGRHRCFRLAGPDVARALEALARIAPAAPIRSLREGTKAQAVRAARTCYDHLAGRLGVALMSALIADGALTGGDGPRPRLSPQRGRRPQARRSRRRRRRRPRRPARPDSLLRGLERAGPPPQRSPRRGAGHSPVRPALGQAPPAHPRGARDRRWPARAGRAVRHRARLNPATCG